MAEPAGLNARLIPLPVRDPNRPIGLDAPVKPPEPRANRPDGADAAGRPGGPAFADALRPPTRGATAPPAAQLSGLTLPDPGNGLRARAGSSGAALGPVQARPQPTGIADRPRNPGDIGAAPRLEQRLPAPLAQAPDTRPFGIAQDQRFDPPQRLIDLLDAQRGRDVAAEISRLTRNTLFAQSDVTDTATVLDAESRPAGFAVEPGPEIEFRPASEDRPAFQRIADLAVEFRSQDARRIFAAAQAERAASVDLPAGQPSRQRILIDQRV